MKKNSSGFLFVDLAMPDNSNTVTRKIDGMTHGTFTDMWGREVVIEKDHLSEYVKNTTENLKATRTESGEIVGLPIDAQGHDNGDGAGWIKGVELGTDGNVVRFAVDWTDIGRELIGKNIRRYFSPTIDTQNHVILGGSLTNWPATRTKKGKILLRPVEMSEELQTVDDIDDGPLALLADSVRGAIEDLKELITGRVEPPVQIEKGEVMSEQAFDLAVALQHPEIVLEVERRAKEIATAELEAVKHQAHLSEIVAELAGKLPVVADELKTVFEAMPADKAEGLADVLRKLAEKQTVDFSAAGHDKVLSGLQPLPDIYKVYLSKWLAEGNPMVKFFEANAAELGNMSDYDLSEFKKE